MDELTNFRNTFIQLKKYLASPIKEDRDKAGIIQAFEFTFEQSWKAIQKIAENQGLDTGTPKKAFMVALQNNWIRREEEKDFLQMIKDRNLTSHTYVEDIANAVLGRIQQTHFLLFEKLLRRLEKEINAQSQEPG